MPETPDQNTPQPTPTETPPTPPAPPTDTPPSTDNTPPAEPPKGDWPADWRNQMAREIAGQGATDESIEKTAKGLSKYTSPLAVAKHLRELEAKLTSGEYKKTVAAPEGEAELAAWRKERGIPEKPEGYLENLPKGVEISDEIKPAALEFANAMHKANESPETVARVLETYFKMEADAEAKRAEYHAELKQTAQTDLNKEYGQEYTANMKMAADVINNAFGADFYNQLSQAVMPNGVPLGSDRTFLRGIVEVARNIKGYSPILPDGVTSDAGLDAEIKKYMDMIATDPNTYYGSAAHQARFTELNLWKERNKR